MCNFLMSSSSHSNPSVLALIHRAVRAPSSHNTQPWLFHLSRSVIDLFADRARVLPVNDPDDRELLISCGCALMNLRIAAAAQGFEMRVEPLPDGQNPEWLARAEISRESGTPAPEGVLAEFIDRRRTYRRHFAARDVDAATVGRLVDAASVEGAWLRPLVSDETRQQVADLVAEGDAAQWADPAWRRELAAWVRPRRRGDGLTVPALVAPMARFVVRGLDMGSRVGAKDRALAEQSPLLAVLGTDRDDPHARLVAGQALQHVLLVACQHGLQASHLNQPIQVATLRPKVQGLVGGGFPQILLRFGYPAEDIPSAPRREIEAVIRRASHGAEAQ